MAQAQALQQRETEAQTFCRILFHDDRNSFYIVSTDEGGYWHDEAFKAEDLISRKGYSDANWYVTHNGFTGRCRQMERTRQLNTLFFDIDCHKAPLESLSDLVEKALARIDEAVATGRLPKPSLIVDSGRGIHLYYVLDRSVPYRFRGGGEVNEKGERFFEKVQQQLADLLEEIVAGLDHMEVDRSVFDHTRVSRIPGTWNEKAWRFARLVSTCEDYHHLSNLASYQPVKKRQETKRSRARILAYNPLMMMRLNKIMELQEYRNFECEGNRELMGFVFYNTAVQIYSREEAANVLQTFNARFTNPLPQPELDGIVRSVDKVTNVRGESGFYVLKADKVMELLALTDEEMEATCFFASKRMMERMEAKRKTKQKRESRNAEIVKLYSTGTMTQEAVSKAVGCSVRTVKAVLAKEGLTRQYKRSGGAKKAPVRKVSLRELAASKLASVSASLLEGSSQVQKIVKRVYGSAQRGMQTKAWTRKTCKTYGSLEGIRERASEFNASKLWTIALPNQAGP